MIYMFDEVLERMVYTMPLDVEVDVAAAVRIAKIYKGMNKETREYLLSRLEMLKDEE